MGSWGRGIYVKTSHSVERASDEGQPPTGHGDDGDRGTPDPESDVATVLLSKRWQKRGEPFRGFDSPPGKF
jgi:hypothetical protein